MGLFGVDVWARWSTDAIEGRISLAGEATEPDHPSTVHGAYLSGRRRAAEEVSAR